MTMWQIYLWLKLDCVQYLLIVSGALMTMASISVFFILDMAEVEGSKRPLLLLIISIPIFVMGLLIPNSKQFAVMYLAPKIMQQENIEFISNENKEIYKMLKEYLKNKLKEQSYEN